MIRRKLVNFATRKNNHVKNNIIMNILKDYELLQIVGGGYWWLTPMGEWIYIENDEEPDGDTTIT